MSFFRLSISILLIRLKEIFFLTHFGRGNSSSERTKKLSESPSQAKKDLTAGQDVLVISKSSQCPRMCVGKFTCCSRSKDSRISQNLVV